MLVCRRLLTIVCVCIVASLPLAAAAAKSPPETSHDGLTLIPKGRAGLVYLKSGADFSVYDRIALLECMVAFKKNWQREQNQTDPFRISKKDMDDIRAALSALFAEVFSEELTKGGYALVDSAAPDVLVLRPAIIDLDIASPGAADMKSGRSRSFATSAGAMTLVLELYDSTTGEILGRVADRRAGRDSGMMMWQNAATNRTEATRMLRTWAAALRNGLDELRTRGVPPVAE